MFKYQSEVPVKGLGIFVDKKLQELKGLEEKMIFAGTNLLIKQCTFSLSTKASN